MTMNKEAADKISRARAVLLITQPFWGVLAMQLRLTEELTESTMATDGESIFYSPDFVLSLPDAEVRGVLAHETEHIARLHHTRRGRREPGLWNEAADHSINPGLLAGGFKLPDSALVDQRFTNRTAEEIYAVLSKEAQPGQSAGQLVASQGPGNGHPKTPQTPGGFGQVRDAPGGEAGRAAAEMKAETAVRHAAAVARKQGAGKLPGFVEEILRDLDKPRVDWRAVLRRFADESAIKETAWTRPNRRYPAPLILPGKASAACAKIVAGVDRSYSCVKALAPFGAELQGMMDEGCADQITAVYFNTRVTGFESFEAGDLLTLHAKGGGGTCFAPVLSWISTEHPDAACIVFLTDLDASDWSAVKDPGLPVLWAATGNYRPSQGVPFGEVVQIDPHA